MKNETAMRLPPDEVDRINGGIISWNLSQEDWDKLAQVPWNTHQATLLHLLRDGGNRPLSEIEMSSQGVAWQPTKPNLVAFNKMLKKHVDNLNFSKKEGSYYRLLRPGLDAKYAIQRYGYSSKQ